MSALKFATFGPSIVVMSHEYSPCETLERSEISKLLHFVICPELVNSSIGSCEICLRYVGHSQLPLNLERLL